MPALTSATAFGGSPYASPWDDLPLPGNTTIGKTDTDTLRRVLHKLGVPEAYTAGRNALCERYRQMLAKIGNSASDNAITEYLKKYQD